MLIYVKYLFREILFY